MVVQTLSIALLVASLFTDILHLRDGNRHRGTLLREDGKVVVFRIESAGGGASVVRQFDRRDVLRIEYRVQEDGDDGAEAAGEAPEAEAGPGHTGVLIQMLREALELIADNEPASALRALQRIVARSDEPQRVTLDALAREARNRSLAALLAEVRIAAALEAGRGRGFEIRYATRYERSSLGEQLEQLQNSLANALVGGRPLIQWTIDEYGRLDANARQIVGHAQLLSGVVGARLKFDGRLAATGRARAEVAALRGRMADLAAHIAAMEGYTNPTEEAAADDPTLAAARRLLAENRAASQPASGPSTQPASAPVSAPGDGASQPRDGEKRR